jgi:hypothetical protein
VRKISHLEIKGKTVSEYEPNDVFISINKAKKISQRDRENRKEMFFRLRSD